MKIYCTRDSKLTSWGCPKDVTPQTSFWDALRAFAGYFAKLSEYTTAYFSVFHATHLVSGIENNTGIMCFVSCLKLMMSL